tara:strand:- start:490 stop:675 length:186 start_codon:yes stop_codon:yes gene_type:complete
MIIAIIDNMMSKIMVIGTIRRIIERKVSESKNKLKNITEKTRGVRYFDSLMIFRISRKFIF